MNLVPISSIISPTPEELDEGKVGDFLKKIGAKAKKFASKLKRKPKVDPKKAAEARAKEEKKQAEKNHQDQQKKQAAKRQDQQSAAAAKDKASAAAKPKPKPSGGGGGAPAKPAAKTKKQLPTGTKEKASPKGKAPHDQVPAQLRHCMLALKHKRGKSAKAAWNICRWSLTKHGYMKGPYRINTKLPKATKMTGRGSRRSFQHGMEKGPLGGGIPGNGGTKYRKFNKMFKEIEKDVIKKGTP